MTIIKIGGALIGEQGAPAALWAGLKTLRQQDSVVLLHGGGPYATEVARRLNHTPRLVHGRRITTDLDLEIVQWTLRGALNVRLVAQARAYGVPAVGLSGVDDGLIQVNKRPPRLIDGEMIDFGWVGDVTGVQVDVLRLLLDVGRLPIVAPLGVDATGQVYNVNADTVAVSVAAALGAQRLFLVAEAGGVWHDPEDTSSRLTTCTQADYDAGSRDGWIVGGMRVKLEVAFQALKAGIPEVFILAPDHLCEPTQGTRIMLSP
jgi:acetylglutamate kinase